MINQQLKQELEDTLQTYCEDLIAGEDFEEHYNDSDITAQNEREAGKELWISDCCPDDEKELINNIEGM